MATGETKLSYLDVVDDIQDGDTVPILRNGKNYMSTGLAGLNADLTDLDRLCPNKVNSTLDELWSLAQSLSANYEMAVFFGNGDLTSALTGGAYTGSSRGFLFRTNSTTFEFVMFYGTAASSASIYTGRIVSGAVSYSVRITGTAVSTTSVGDPVVMGEDETVEDA